jgi:hypothetical protein
LPSKSNYKIITILAIKFLLSKIMNPMIIFVLFSSNKYCLKQVSTFIIASPQLQTTRKYGCLPKDYKFNKEIFRSIYARRSEFI